MDQWFELRIKTAEIWNEGWGRCLEPRWQCKNAPIRAHSIQNSRIIDLIAEKGQVITLGSAYHPTTTPFPDFRVVGRHRATTFEGLCAEHDGEIFRRIDAETLNTSDQEQLFLLAYRAVTCELHTTMAVAYRVQRSYEKAVELGLSPGDHPCERGRFAVARMVIAHSTFRYRSYFDEDLLGGRYDRVHHRVINVPCTRPTLAVSSLFSVDGSASGDDYLLLSLSVLPLAENRTVAIFSWRDFDDVAALAWLNEKVPDGANPKMLRKQVSQITLANCENIIFAPSLLNNLSADEKDRIRRYFFATTFKPDSETEPLEIDLFG